MMRVGAMSGGGMGPGGMGVTVVLVVEIKEDH